MEIVIDESATIMFLSRAHRGKLPDYGTSCRGTMRYVEYDMDSAKDDRKRNRAVTAAIVGSGLTALACMAQHYGALDSNMVSSAIDLLGSCGTSVATLLPAYTSARLIQG